VPLHHELKKGMLHQLLKQAQVDASQWPDL
jgi:hypothetical protein